MVRIRNSRTAPLIINPLQAGGIETSVLDNGPGRDVRIAWVNTGAGLRYKVLLGRGLDIADAEFMGQSLTWHSFAGIVAPSAAYCRGFEWLRSFTGGLVVGAGPLNTGEPFTENGIEYGLHGTHANTPAALEAIVNPDPRTGELEMSITGQVRTARVFGPNVELRRTIRSTLGTPAFTLEDCFTNRGNTPAPFAWLLHCNFGYPLLEPDASTYCYAGRLIPAFNSDAWMAAQKDVRAALPPQETHRGTGEVCWYIDPVADRTGQVTIGVVNRRRNFGLKIEFNQRDYPRLANWQHWGPAGEYVGALEPMTAGLEGREVDKQKGWFETLAPGQSRTLRCTFTALSAPADLTALLALNK
jgi:hypothetical protein